MERIGIGKQVRSASRNQSNSITALFSGNAYGSEPKPKTDIWR